LASPTTKFSNVSRQTLRDAAGAGVVTHLRVYSGLIGADEHKKNPHEVHGLVGLLHHGDLRHVHKLTELGVELRGNDSDAGTRREERLDLAKGDAATAHDEDVLALEIHFDGEKI